MSIVDQIEKRTQARLVTLLRNRLLRYGVHVKPEVGENTVTVWLIDWAQPQANHFAFAEEVTVNAANAKTSGKRPDIVLYFNGIALYSGTQALHRIGGPAAAALCQAAAPVTARDGQRRKPLLHGAALPAADARTGGDGARCDSRPSHAGPFRASGRNDRAATEGFTCFRAGADRTAPLRSSCLRARTRTATARLRRQPGP